MYFANRETTRTEAPGRHCVSIWKVWQISQGKRLPCSAARRLFAVCHSPVLVFQSWRCQHEMLGIIPAGKRILAESNGGAATIRNLIDVRRSLYYGIRASR